MTDAAAVQEIRVRALIAIALVERLAHELDGHTDKLRALIEAERETDSDE